MQMQTGTEMLILSCSLQRMDETVKGAMPMLMPELVKRARRLCFLARRAGEREEDRECFTKTRVKTKRKSGGVFFEKRKSDGVHTS